jgi:hypothetical protein
VTATRDRTKFGIQKTDFGCWVLTYPDGFHTINAGVLCGSFAAAVELFTIEADKQCPMCLRGQVHDTDWGWECHACGSSDVAVGCTR